MRESRKKQELLMRENKEKNNNKQDIALIEKEYRSKIKNMRNALKNKYQIELALMKEECAFIPEITLDILKANLKKNNRDVISLVPAPCCNKYIEFCGTKTPSMCDYCSSWHITIG